MKIKNIGSNQTEVTTEKLAWLVSYETPAAVRVLSTGEEFHCAGEHSKTTTKHINAWVSSGAKKISAGAILELIK